MPRTDTASIAGESLVLARTEEAVLVPHPASPRLGVDAIRADVALEADGSLTLTYVLAGDVEGLRIPPVGPVSPGDRLWEHTCFEAFLRADDAPEYLEFNFSPARQWASYAFRGYREAVGPWSVSTPSIEVRRSVDRLELCVRLPRAAASPMHRASRLWLALSAVIESSEGQLAYWALRHPEGRPDFHHGDAFAFVVDAPVSGVPT
jgi:hypothetical protein